MGHELARLFKYDHLPPELQEVFKPFADLADKLMYGDYGRDPLMYEALLRLWDAKNLAVIAAARPS